MRVIELSEYGGPEVLRLAERPEPEVAPGRVRVRVAASTINPVDQAVRAGVMGEFPKPLVLGWDLAGTVIEETEGFHAGQRVVGMVPMYADRQGTYAEVVSAEPGWLAPLPEDADLVAAATIPLNALTASQALDLLDVHSGQRLLVTGASGGVGGYAVQLAARSGIDVVAVASAGDEDYVAGLGAKEVSADLPGQRVDAVLDAGNTGTSLIGAVRDGGVFIAVVPQGVPGAERGIRTDWVQVKPDAARLRDLVTAGLRTRIADVLPLVDAAEAHRRAAARGLRGKLVLRVSRG
ncbi:NADP-dependent oxidoreductase [Allokutzneria sp. A3M-2-11 16]|uniref:NADP-dependent oxidoreductase n=1 Tax=Allokutzneria sp. A3M-2-11 16 TaxID=2962043 RepID=UPI0020B7642D|nr:NADP-dependent oxidoreductase [Allokutzneria sp. A3M-2-11 16]MCP3802113.1 NADP-dependent oxidoreductase [Allokutzneria sp. A3M-2-11 16]